jgi:HK97 family phage major capsid protein
MPAILTPEQVPVDRADEIVDEYTKGIRALTDRNKAIYEAAVADDRQLDLGDGTKTGAVFTAEDQTEFRTNLDNIKSMRSTVEAIEGWRGLRESVDAEAAAGDSDGPSVADLIRKAAGGLPPGLVDRPGLADLFVKSDEFAEMLKSGRSTMASPFVVPAGRSLAELSGRKDIYTALPSGSFDFGVTQREPVVTRAFRRLRIRDLFNVRSTTANLIEYIRVTGVTNNASVVPERDGGDFASKPQSTWTFAAESAAVRTIAHWEVVHRNTLADQPGLRGVLEDELFYGLQLHEDYQILQGTGTGEDLLGIQNVSGVQTYSWSAGATTPVPDTKVDAIRRAMTLSFLAFYKPTEVVVHPTDWEEMELTKSAVEGMYLLAATIAAGGQPTVWRVPVVETPAIQSGRALVGAFGLGATLWDREQSQIRVAEQHGDLFIKNAVLVLAEQRLALTTQRPESFVDVTFDAAPS